MSRLADEMLRDLEKEALNGNGINSTMSATTYRNVRGLRAEVTSINSTVAANSFAADPHAWWAADAHDPGDRSHGETQ